MQEFASYFEVAPTTTVLDVGGTMSNWELIPDQPQLTVVNVSMPPEELPGNVTWYVADGRALPFSSGGFELGFSNSVIEHLGTWEDQVAFAEEIRRVGRSYYVQTPNYWFPVEPHLVTPFIHWVPLRLRKRMLRNFTVWGLLTRPEPEYCVQFSREVRLLTLSEMKKLFPDAHIVVERVLGLPKSFIAVKK